MVQQENSFEYDELLQRCMGNLEFAERILSRFGSRLEGDIEELEKQILSGDCGGIIRVAHRIKGASANTSATGIQMQTNQIEDMARAQQLDELPMQLEQLKEEVARFSLSVSTQFASVDNTAKDNTAKLTGTI